MTLTFCENVTNMSFSTIFNKMRVLANKPLKHFLCCLVFAFFIIILLYIKSSAITQPRFVNLKLLLSICIKAAQRGGVIVKHVREENLLNSTSKGKTKEGANDPLTQGDILSHIEMYNLINENFPFIKIISEEHVNKVILGKIKPIDNSLDLEFLPDQLVKIEDVSIWIDPLDATQEYTENLLQYVTTMVCVAIKGVPIIGVIYKPFEKPDNDLFWAWVGKGTSMNLKRHRVNDQPIIIISRSHSGETKQKIKDMFGDSYNIIQAGGAGYKLIELAKGRADIYLHSTYIKKWDICPGNAILNALGGNLTDLKGNAINYFYQDDYVMKDGLIAYGP